MTMDEREGIELMATTCTALFYLTVRDQALGQVRLVLNVYNEE